MDEDLFIVEYEKVNSAWLLLDETKRKIWGILSLARIKVPINKIIQISPLTNKLLFESIIDMCKNFILYCTPINSDEMDNYHKYLRELYIWCLDNDEDNSIETNNFLEITGGLSKVQIRDHICGIRLFLTYLLDPSIGNRIGNTPTIALIDDFFRDKYNVDYFSGGLNEIVEVEEEYKRIWADYRFINSNYSLNELKQRMEIYERIDVCKILT